LPRSRKSGFFEKPEWSTWSGMLIRRQRQANVLFIATFNSCLGCLELNAYGPYLSAY
jgi:hypothetical protein